METRAWSRELGVSQEAVELFVASEVFDLHVDSFIWTRVFGYDLLRDNGHGPLGGRMFGQCDVPRAVESGLACVTWSITTNPWRTTRGRRRVFFDNLAKLRRLLRRAPGVELVRNGRELRAARQRGQQAAVLGIQGANALDGDLEDVAALAGSEVVRATLMGFTHSSLGEASETVPAWLPRPHRGITEKGRQLVRVLNRARIAVDLAHASRRTFFDALEVHDPSLPFLVSHAGIAAVHDRPRNLDGEQLRALAAHGGVVGIILKPSVLCDGEATIDTVIDHIAAAQRAVGDDHVALGSDWDGVMTPPRELPTPLHLPRLVQRMLDRGLSPDSIQKTLGGNALRVLDDLRG